MSAKILDADCVKILRNYLITNKDIKFISSEFNSISENVEGFLGEHYKLVINYEEKGVQKSQTFFVKNKPTNPAQAEMTEGYGVYKREIFIYEILFKEFEKYGCSTSFAAKSYYSIPEESLVMEDVTQKGFSLTNRNVNLTVDHLKCALKSLALYHAAGYVFERRKTTELKRKFVLGEQYGEYLKEAFFVQYIDQNEFAMNSWDCGLKTLDVLIDLLPHDDLYKEEFKHLIRNAEFGKAFAPNTSSKINKTCGHGDLWSNNLLFKYENNIPVECCLVDFQISRYSYPCFDVLLSVFGNTDRQFRKLHLEELYSYYHETLSQILKDYGYDIQEIHPLKDFYDSIGFVKVEALMQIVLTAIIVLLPKNRINDLSKEESGMQEIIFDNSQLAAESFHNVTTYREKISELIYELREALIERCQN